MFTYVEHFLNFIFKSSNKALNRSISIMYAHFIAAPTREQIA